MQGSASRAGVCLFRPYTTAATALATRVPAHLADWAHRLLTHTPQETLDTIDLARATAIHHTLPTRSPHLSVETFPPDNKIASGTQTIPPRGGDPLPPGWTLCYHWPIGYVENLGRDGSATVSLTSYPC